MDLIYKSVKIVSLTSLLLLSGCSVMSNRNQNILPDGGPTTQEVYDGAHSADGKANTDDSYYNLQRDLQTPRDPGPWTRNQANELDNLFPRIPNLEITGYVFPHLSSGGHPVPGYSTSFPVYEQPHYALPGEAMAITEQSNTGGN